MSIRKLKIDIKMLAETAKIIRKEERKVLGSARWQLNKERQDLANSRVVSEMIYGEYTDLHNRRVVDIRVAARTSLLAYAFLRGRTLANTEAWKTKRELDDDTWLWAKTFKKAWQVKSGKPLMKFSWETRKVDPEESEMSANFVAWLDASCTNGHLKTRSFIQQIA